MYLGVDVGGTTIKFAVIDKDLNIIHYETCKTPDNFSETIINKVYETARDIKQKYDYSFIGVSTAGVVDNKNMKIVSCAGAIKNYAGADYIKDVAEPLGVKLYADNDVNCALLGEQWLGAAKGLEEVFCVALGTGIGGSYYLDRLPSGSNFSVGEIGQMICNDGSGLTFEQKASTIALERLVKEEFGESTTVIEFFEKCKENHEKSLEILDKWLTELATGLVNTLLVIDPKYVIIGGAISKQGDYLIEKIQTKVQKLMPVAANRTKFIPAKLENNAAIYGAISPFAR